MPPRSPVVLDGALGTELLARGVALPGAAWSAGAIAAAPDAIAEVHRAYAAAGATVHTAATFRTTRRAMGDGWEGDARRAIELARTAVPEGHLVAGSIAPLEDCYRPDLAPTDSRAEHRALARALAGAGVDLLLCETFPLVREALVAVEEAAATGLPAWVSFTGGPRADLLSPDAILRGAREAVARGAAAVLVNCTPADRTEAYVEALAEVGVPFGAYANAGPAEDAIGWAPAGSEAARRGAAAYARFAERWLDRGASIVGGCCGTGPDHVAAIARAFAARLQPGT